MEVEEGFSFQVICISGYDAGSLSGYFKEEQKAIEDNKINVSKTHFIKEIERNFGKIDKKTLRFLDVL